MFSHMGQTSVFFHIWLYFPFFSMYNKIYAQINNILYGRKLK